MFDPTAVLAKHANDPTRVIIEVRIIANGNCVNKPSVALTPKELTFLESVNHGTHFDKHFDALFLSVCLSCILSRRINIFFLAK